MKHVRFFTLGGLVLACAGSVMGQGMPTTQPGLLNIVREEVKPGRAADHQKLEAGWPAAYEKSKSPYYYLALVSMTGRPEAWYVSPYASHAALGENFKRDDADAVLTAETTRLSKADADLLTGLTVIQAVGRLDLSLGTFPEMARQRFYEVTTFRIRPGYDQDFEAVSKTYRTTAQRAAPSTTYRVYQVIAGVAGSQYLVFSSFDNFAALDKAGADGGAVMQAHAPADLAALQKLAREGILSIETQRFRLDPLQSYVPKETRDVDPAFWRPKKPVTKPPPQ